MPNSGFTSWMIATGLLLLTLQPIQGQTWQAGPLGSTSIELNAFWEPLTDAVYQFDQKPLIRDLVVAEKQKSWRSSDFQVFMPKQPVAIGDSWTVDPNLVLPFLKQFHPGANADLHHGAVSAPGGWACLSALDNRFAEIRFRVHAEFVLDGDGSFPNSSWYTPAQFQGKITVDCNSNSVVGFQMGVPDQSANVDLNLPTGADIGRVPRMELIGGTFPEFDGKNRGITDDEVCSLLAKKFYQFAEVNWLSLPEARRQSLQTGKPLHVIALFGSLDDESC